MNQESMSQPVQCPKCGAALTVHMDRWHAEARLRQLYTCPVCAGRHEGTFGGRVVRVTRRLETA